MNMDNYASTLIKYIKMHNNELIRLKKLELNMKIFFSFMFLLVLFIYMIYDVFFEYNFTHLIIILATLLFCGLVISNIYLEYKIKETKKVLKKINNTVSNSTVLDELTKKCYVIPFTICLKILINWGLMFNMKKQIDILIYDIERTVLALKDTEMKDKDKKVLKIFLMKLYDDVIFYYQVKNLFFSYTNSIYNFNNYISIFRIYL